MLILTGQYFLLENPFGQEEHSCVEDSKNGAGGRALLHNAVRASESAELAKHLSERHSRPRLPKHMPRDTQQQYHSRKENWRKVDIFTQGRSAKQAVRNLRTEQATCSP